LLEFVARIGHLRLPVFVLIAKPKVSVELQLGDGVAEFDLAGRGLGRVAREIGADVLGFLVGEHALRTSASTSALASCADAWDEVVNNAALAKSSEAMPVASARRERPANGCNFCMFSLC